MNPRQMIENRSVLLIFRDCLKLANRMMQADSRKTVAVRELIRREFQKNKDIFDQDKIHSLKMNAVKGITNYIIYTVQKQHNINTKPRNILQEQQQDQLQHLHSIRQ